MISCSQSQSRAIGHLTMMPPWVLELLFQPFPILYLAPSQFSLSSFDSVFCCLRDRPCCLWTEKEKNIICSKTEKNGARHGVWFATPTVSRVGGTGENLPPRFATSSIFPASEGENCHQSASDGSASGKPDSLARAAAFCSATQSNSLLLIGLKYLTPSLLPAPHSSLSSPSSSLLTPLWLALLSSAPTVFLLFVIQEG